MSVTALERCSVAVRGHAVKADTAKAMPQSMVSMQDATCLCLDVVSLDQVRHLLGGSSTGIGAVVQRAYTEKVDAGEKGAGLGP